MQSQSEIRQSITTSIVNSLNEGRIPWRKCHGHEKVSGHEKESGCASTSRRNVANASFVQGKT